MAIDFAIRNVRLPLSLQPTDIGVEGGLIAAIEQGFVCDAPEHDARGKLVCGGLIETHILLGRAGIMGRCSICEGTLAEAVSGVRKQILFDLAAFASDVAWGGGCVSTSSHQRLREPTGAPPLR